MFHIHWFLLTIVCVSCGLVGYIFGAWNTAELFREIESLETERDKLTDYLIRAGPQAKADGPYDDDFSVNPLSKSQ